MSKDVINPYDALRTGLIWGRWKSGERLIPQHLKAEFGCTSSVLREAMLRLAGEGFIVSEKNQGFRTVTHSEETFCEAAHLRLILEREAATLSLQKGDFNWEMAVTAAYQKLAYVEKQMIETQDVQKYVRHWSIQDWEFHATLMSACGSDLLMNAYRSAFDTFRMYAVSTYAHFGFGAEITAKEHLDIYEATIARDVPGCLAAIERHLTLYQEGRRSGAALSSKLPPE
ncbi:GntR family transcriptional regulator [uncultured Roseobacter sp.]|uniref:GntR family transcriptional regulator n=1 Tax=uncultured Roseobacter sp. TaxID=114847 RepID=UPI0026164D81|nr:GntR family transcriptional regulator [uncultured Roseobacter sp.]